MNPPTSDASARLRETVAATLRAHRAQLGLSQRALAERADLPQSAIGRIESGHYDARLSWVVAALEAVGGRLVVPHAAEPTRMAGEYARDQAGRRLPAHLEPYRLLEPHDWWPGQTQILMWRDEPRWSYRRALSQPTLSQPTLSRPALSRPELSEPPARLPPVQRSEPC